jgi:hypothetical protein
MRKEHVMARYAVVHVEAEFDDKEEAGRKAREASELMDEVFLVIELEEKK